MVTVFDLDPPRDLNLSHALRSYALGAVDANLKQMLLRIAAEYDAESSRLDLLKASISDV